MIDSTTDQVKRDHLDDIAEAPLLGERHQAVRDPDETRELVTTAKSLGFTEDEVTQLAKLYDLNQEPHLGS